MILHVNRAILVGQMDVEERRRAIFAMIPYAKSALVLIQAIVRFV